MMTASKHDERRPPSDGGPSDRGTRHNLAFALVLVGMTTAAYANSFRGAFVLDDHRYIANKTRIHDLSAIGPVLSGRRPTVDLTLAANYAVGGVNVWGYHAVNLAIHVLAALTLFGLIRRVLVRAGGSRARSQTAASLAFAAALVWAVHPLQTQAVTYITQRSESLMGLFYLFTLYCVVRGIDSKRRALWYFAAVVSSGLGMGSKGVMITAPVTALLFIHLLSSDGLSQTLRRHWLLWGGLAATTTVLLFCGVAPVVLSATRKSANVGFSFKDITPIAYMLTQPGVVLHYLTLTFWPAPLCLDYGWPVARSASAILPQSLLMLCFVGATCWALFQRRLAALAGAVFFLVLLPTSSIIPIRDPAFEHRMYLPSAGVIVLTVLGIHTLVRALARRMGGGDRTVTRSGTTLVLVAAVALSVGTARRNKIYHDEAVMLRDVISKRPNSSRAYYNLGRLLLNRGMYADATNALREAVRIEPRSAKAFYNLGKALFRLDRMEQAAVQYERALELDPTLAAALSDLGNMQARRGRIDEAIAFYREAIRRQPRYAPAHFNLGTVLLSAGRVRDSLTALRAAAMLSPEEARIYAAMGNALLRNGNRAAAAEAYTRALQLDPDHAGASAAIQALSLQPSTP